MSELAVTAEFRAIAGSIRRQQVLDIVRLLAFVGTLLLAWISLRPFADLGELEVGDVSTGNEAPTYFVFGGLAVLMVVLAMRENLRGLATLLTPSFLLFGGWISLTIVLSSDPSTSMRRFILTLCVFAVTASLLLLPKSQHELMRWFSIAAVALLAVCYLGILLAPHLAVHQSTDLREPLLAGDWRGAFGHKNVAAGVMAMVLFLGIYILRSGAWISGVAIIGLTVLFLLNASGKSSLALCVAVLLLTSLTALVRSFWMRAILLLTPLALLNLLSVGTVMSDGLAAFAKLLPFDTTFTGRTDIWTFALQSLQAKLLTGYGFVAFWGTGGIQNLNEGKEWAALSSHSHNGYLDTALGMGVPGLILLIVVLVVVPLRNFQRADAAGNGGPLAMAFLQIWLFGLYLSSMESFFLDRADPTWVTFLLAVLGLHYLARFRTE